MQNVEIPHHASLLAGTVLGYLERLQIEVVKQYYIFNGGLSTMSYSHHGLSTCKVHISYFLNNGNRTNGEVPPRHLPAGRTEIPSSTSNKPEKLN